MGLRATTSRHQRAGLKRPRRGYWITDSQITGRSTARCSTRCRRPFSSSFPLVSGASRVCTARLSQYGPTYYAYRPSWLLSKRRKYRRIPLEKPTANVRAQPATDSRVGPAWLGGNVLSCCPRTKLLTYINDHSWLLIDVALDSAIGTWENAIHWRLLISTP